MSSQRTVLFVFAILLTILISACGSGSAVPVAESAPVEAVAEVVMPEVAPVQEVAATEAPAQESAPNIGGMLRVTDGVTVTLNIVAEEVQ